MAHQVKFYSTTADQFASASKDAAGIYFVNGGEIYKGSERFGANKVWESKPDGNAGVISGDLFISGGLVQVFNGSEWKGITNENKWTASSVGGEGQYIQSINQGKDGTVTATAVSFPTLATGTTDGTLKLGSGADAKVAGWDTVKSDISHLKSVVSYSGAGDSVVTATTGNFTNLNVSGTASFTATTVSATTLTVGGVSVNNIAATQGFGSSAGIAVAVSTANGGVTGVGVVVTSADLLQSLALSDFAGKTVVEALGPSTGSGAATDDQIPTALAVAKKLATLDNAMHFREVVASTGAITDPAKGDIVVIGSTPAGGFASGQEYIYDGTKWELIGDQNTYAINAYTSTASVYNGVATVPGALNAVGAKADTFQATLDAKVTTGSEVSAAAKASNLVTAGAVANYVSQEITGLSLGDASKKGVANTITTNGVSLPTESAVASYVTGVVNGLDSSVSSNENSALKVGVKQVDGKVTAVTAEFVWLDASGSVIS